jgi:hypothetical protein
MYRSLLILTTLEDKMKSKVKGYSSLHEIKKSVFNFPLLSETEKNEIEKYLDSMIEKQVSQTLEQYMSEKLGLKTNESFDPDKCEKIENKITMSALASFNSGNIEDFTIELPNKEPIGDSKFHKIIEDYFKESGYKIDEKRGDFEMPGGIKAEKGGKKIFVNYSNFSSWNGTVMVSVLPIY